ncbi:RQC-minor-2 family DNA-binding protein [Metabacillus indicus]|uniref:RQC-minor-2 family DNA-binding protein n=1 Tax=Metabacillus indicus TaxID=246786 RepID=UPI002A08C5AC|nr:RQC-minor-2 family DNA-binding protein [Metabacillus indicus]MDX8289837.1 RQC-minor-2 family DNA-binding protein [Metabacillus indicus]
MQLQQIAYQFGDYPSLLFVPAGRKYPEIRSIGHKEERAALSRLEQAAAKELLSVPEEEMTLLKTFLGTDRPSIPLPVYKQERLYPHLIRPEMFLWKKHSVQRGLPISTGYFYPETYGTLSAQDLSRHVKKVVQDYLFCARLNKFERKHWIEKINTAYTQHPLIRLASSKEAVIHAVEIMNKSSLLGVLKYPEDISYWRHRVEIVMRPYRSIPKAWQWTVCSHEKELTLHADTDSIICTCSACRYSVSYRVSKDEVSLPDEVNIPQATKRIATIERQFNEIAVQSEETMEKLYALKEIQTVLEQHAPIIKQILDMQTRLGSAAETHPAAAIYTEIEQLSFPDAIQPSLLSLASISVPDASVLKRAENWSKQLPHDLDESLARHLQKLQELAEQHKPQADDVMFEIKEFRLLRSHLEKIQLFLQEETVQNHMLVQILRGEATSKIRRSGFHEAEVFGLLNEWPAKYITKAIIKSC